MKIKLDENMPLRLGQVLSHYGHHIDTVPQEGLTGHQDAEIWEAAQRAGRFLITQDIDFSDIRRFTPGTHNGLLLVRLRDPGRDALLRKVDKIYQTEEVENWNGCLVVVTERKIRVRRPQDLIDSQ